MKKVFFQNRTKNIFHWSKNRNLDFLIFDNFLDFLIFFVGSAALAEGLFIMQNTVCCYIFVPDTLDFLSDAWFKG